MDGPFGDGDLGRALIRDGNGARAFDTLLRYRGAAQAEVSRALHLLKALQAEAAARELPAAASPPELPNQPEARGNPGESRCQAASAAASPVPDPAAPVAEATPPPGVAHSHPPDPRKPCLGASQRGVT
jgi:hypothetical protein